MAPGDLSDLPFDYDTKDESEYMPQLHGHFDFSSCPTSIGTDTVFSNGPSNETRASSVTAEETLWSASDWSLLMTGVCFIPIPNI